MSLNTRMRCHKDVQGLLYVYVLTRWMKEPIDPRFYIVSCHFCASSTCCLLETGSEHFKRDKKQEEERFQNFPGCSLGERFFLFIPGIDQIAGMCQGELWGSCQGIRRSEGETRVSGQKKREMEPPWWDMTRTSSLTHVTSCEMKMPLQQMVSFKEY